MGQLGGNKAVLVFLLVLRLPRSGLLELADDGLRLLLGGGVESECAAFDIEPWRGEVGNNILAHHTGQDPEKINVDTERDNFMSAEEAKAYGLIDEVVTRPKAPSTEKNA